MIPPSFSLITWHFWHGKSKESEKKIEKGERGRRMKNNSKVSIQLFDSNDIVCLHAASVINVYARGYAIIEFRVIKSITFTARRRR